MKELRQSIRLDLVPIDNRRLADLSGQLNEHIRYIEQFLGVEINNRGNVFKIIGEPSCVEKAAVVLQQLYAETQINKIDLAKIASVLQTVDKQNHDANASPPDYNRLVLHTRQLKIRARTPNQFSYLNNINTHDINFGVGPAGTGKTYLAVACAVAALEAGKIQRIILVRPAVEAGERLGFLPGDLAQKVDPYLRPLFDALYEMLGVEHVDKLIQRNIIEVAPLAYMRGRTLNDAFIILDESQNTTREQMKMFLTRIGFHSKTVITGDITQTDLPKKEMSGLRHAIAILSEVKGIYFNFFQAHDVVRHPLVRLIIQAYEKNEL